MSVLLQPRRYSAGAQTAKKWFLLSQYADISSFGINNESQLMDRTVFGIYNHLNVLCCTNSITQMKIVMTKLSHAPYSSAKIKIIGIIFNWWVASRDITVIAIAKSKSRACLQKMRLAASESSVELYFTHPVGKYNFLMGYMRWKFIAVFGSF